MIATFYSYKGGVGRSMCLASTAVFLYRAGLRVLAVDFDLEAPGLEYYFSDPTPSTGSRVVFPDRAFIRQLDNRPGLLELLERYKVRASGSLTSLGHDDSVHRATSLDFPEPHHKHIPVSRKTSLQEMDLLMAPDDGGHPLSDFVSTLVGTDGGGSLSLLHAGRKNDPTFADRLNLQSWGHLYSELAGFTFVEWLRSQMLTLADIVLIDSRTGLTEMGGVCTHQLADVAIIILAMNEQNISGSERVARSLLFNTNQLSYRSGRRSPSVALIPSRVEGSSNLQARFDSLVAGLSAINEDVASAALWRTDIILPHAPQYSSGERNPAMDVVKFPGSWDTLMNGVARGHLSLAQLIVRESVTRRTEVQSTRITEAIEERAESRTGVPTPSSLSQMTRESKKLELLLTYAEDAQNWATLLLAGLKASGSMGLPLKWPIGGGDDLHEDLWVPAGVTSVELNAPAHLGSHSGHPVSDRIGFIAKWAHVTSDSSVNTGVIRKIVLLLSPEYGQSQRLDPIRWVDSTPLSELVKQRRLIVVQVGDESTLPREFFRFQRDWIVWDTPSDITAVLSKILELCGGTVPIQKDATPLRVDSLAQNLPSGVSDTRGWSDEQVSYRYNEVKKQLDWDSTTGSARKWWDAFETENNFRSALVLRLAEELAIRKATITEFFLAYVYSNTDNIQANLHYLDYSRLKREEEKRKKAAASMARDAEEAQRATRVSEVTAKVLMSFARGEMRPQLTEEERVLLASQTPTGWAEEHLAALQAILRDDTIAETEKGDLSGGDVTRSLDTSENPELSQRRCPSCRFILSTEADRCPRCGANLSEDK